MKARFQGASVGSLDALARALRINILPLLTIAGSTSDRYVDFQVDKKDGSKRDVSGPQKDLKLIQKRINRHFFERVEYPSYLYGGIKGRDYVQNATVHGGAKVVLAMDVENFFPRVTSAQIHQIFQNFFCIPHAVAEVLTQLCSRGGTLPQGACTSTYLSNLIFFEYEPRLVKALEMEGLKYSRLIDDITISSLTPLSKQRISKIIERVSAMLKTGGFRLKRKKTKVSSQANPKDLMEVTGLFLNRGRPRVKSEERVDIRSEVRKCVRDSGIDRCDHGYHELHERVSGRVAKLSQLNHFEASRFRGELQKILPLYNSEDFRKTRGMVAGIAKSSKSSRATIGYIERYYQIIYRINIVARSNAAYAGKLREKMNRCKPLVSKEGAIHGSTAF